MRYMSKFKNVRYILMFLMLMSGLTVSAKHAFAQNASTDSLQSELANLSQENILFRTRIGQLEEETAKAVKQVAQERRNINYFYAAYAIIWVVVFGFIFNQFSRIKQLLEEIEKLRSTIKTSGLSE